MSESDLLMFRFLLASGGCVAAGLGVWGLMALLRRLPGFSSQRSIWLLSQVTIVATFLVILLPHSERLRLVPQIEIDSVTELHTASPDGGAAAPSPVADVVSPPAAEPPARSWLVYGAQAWLLIYLLGLVYAIFRLWHGRRILQLLAAAGSRVNAQNQHAGFATTPAPAPALAVIEVDAPISPMLFGLFQPRLLLPRHLRSFDEAQQQMIIEHELTHLRRHDLQWMSAGIFLQTLLWFNPFMRLLRANLSWAQELSCDRDVLSGRPREQRKAYAAALVAQLKMQHRPVNTALAFGGVSADTLAQRISLIREPVSSVRGKWARRAALGGLAGIFAASLAFQPALAWRSEPASEPTSAAAPAAAGKRLWSFTGSAPEAYSCTEMADAASGQRLVHDGQCDARVTPASTFNIAVSLMGYDSGILRDEHAPKLPFKPGYPRWNPSWRAATDPSSFMSNSVLWYAQQVTTELGATRLQRYISSFNYGNNDLSGDPGKNNGLTLSWVASSLEISPVEQVAFLRKVVNRQLPLTPKAYDMTMRIMKPETLPNGWVIQGKTGTAGPVLADGRDDPKHQYGWYVGWAKKGQRTIVFARLALLKRHESNAAGPRVKAAFLRDLTTQLDTL